MFQLSARAGASNKKAEVPAERIRHRASLLPERRWWAASEIPTSSDIDPDDQFQAAA
jgi:hypothetical protein